MTRFEQTEIFLIRHGETEWNVEERYQGRRDSPLTDRGCEQSKHYGLWLSKMVRKPDTVYSSPLGRARQTEAILRPFLNAPTTRWDDRLQEVDFGSWTGIQRADILTDPSNKHHGQGCSSTRFGSPDGESLDAALCRAASWLGELEGTVIAVTHGLICRVIEAAYVGRPKQAMEWSPLAHGTILHLKRGSAAHILL
ncbi:MAG: histidine phosphatase family protein [Pseudomonadota bacterium]